MGRRRVSEEFLTEDQIRRREINDRYNKKRKVSQPMDNILSINKKSNLDVRRAPLDVTQRKVKVNDGGKQWHDLVMYFTSPRSILQISIATILTSYCTYQSVLYFCASDTDKVSAITTAIAAEFVLVSSEILFAMSNTKIYRAATFIFLAITMFCVGSLIHGSISGIDSSNSKSIELKTQERDALVSIYKTIESNISNIPDDQISRKNKEISKYSEINSRIEKVNDEIVSLNSRVSGVGVYSWWIRVAAMILNAFIINSLLRKSPI